LPNPLMRSCLVEVDHIGIEHALELPLMQNQQVIEAFLPHAPGEALTDRIGLWPVIGGCENLDATGPRHSSEARPKFGIVLTYFWMVRLHTRMPSFRSSPRIRSAPHSRCSVAICLIKAMVSEATLGLQAGALDLRFQYRRKSSRCHLSRVSGCTITRACCHVRTHLAKSTRSTRSVLVHTGLFTWRLRMISC